MQLSEIIANIRIAETNKDYKTAAKLCMSAIMISSSDDSLVIWLGWILFNDRQYKAAMDCANKAIKRGVTHNIEAYRLLIYCAAANGSWERANHAFEYLESKSSDICHSLALETICAFLAYISTQDKIKNFTEVIRVYEQLPRCIRQIGNGDVYDIDLIGAHAYVTLGKSYHAQRCLKDSGIIETYDNDLSPMSPLAGVTFITSLMPSRREHQQKAVKSWHDNGAKSISINIGDEIACLREFYPDVVFVEATRDACKQFGKPYVYLSDMLNVLEKEKNNIVGIINSDIILQSPNIAFLEGIKHEASRSLVFGHRSDIESIKYIADPAAEMQLFTGGYDWFLFPRTYAHLLADQPFIFGCPWWDLWLPILASSLGINLFVAHGQFAYHVTHPQRWDNESLISLGFEVLRQAKMRNFSNSSGVASRYLSIFARSYDADSSKNLDSFRLMGRFAGLIRALIATNSSRIVE